MRNAILLLLLVAALAAFWWFGQQRQAEPIGLVEYSAPAPRPEPRFPLPEPEPEPPRPAPIPDDPTEPEEPPAAVEVIETIEAPEPLPTLIESDAAAVGQLGALLGEAFVERWIQPNWVISRVVAMVHSLDGPAPMVESRPLATLRSLPRTQAGAAETLYWTATTAQRYAELLAGLAAAPPAEVGASYRRHYPLFQQAWEELGEAEPYFNDRLVDIIDHLLAAPSVELPVEVVAWEGRLKFADEALEDESWGRKLLIRLGPDQAGVVKDWLRALRQELTGQRG